MNCDYITVYTDGTGEYEEKKSRFLSAVYHVTDTEQVERILQETRKKYYDASHHCYAYSIGPKEDSVKCSDAGEPSGTAGLPILTVIRNAGLRDTLIVVTRYFGGTLLGTGGLVRSYTKAAQDGLAHSVLAHKYPADLLEIGTDYGGIGKLQYLFAEEDLSPLRTEYADAVRITIPIPSDRTEGIVKKIRDLTNGKAGIANTKQVFFARIGRETVLFDS